jgi:hypothetical protein
MDFLTPTFLLTLSTVSMHMAVQEQACLTSPLNGQVLEDRVDWLGSTNAVEIRNGSRGNAIVKIREAATGKLLVTVFILRNETARYDGIPDGIYTIQYAIGNRLNTHCTNFPRFDSIGEFPPSAPLVSEVSASGETRSHTLRYTLFPVPGGNVTPHAIDASAFNAP